MKIHFELDTLIENPKVVQSILEALSMAEFAQATPPSIVPESPFTEVKEDHPIVTDDLINAVKRPLSELDPSSKRWSVLSALQIRNLTTEEALIIVFEHIKNGDISRIGRLYKNGDRYRLPLLDKLKNFRQVTIPNRWGSTGSYIKQSTMYADNKLRKMVISHHVIGFNPELNPNHAKTICSVGTPTTANNSETE